MSQRYYPPGFVNSYKVMLKVYFKLDVNPTDRFQVRCRIDSFYGVEARDRRIELFLPITKDIRIVLMSRKASLKYLLLELGKYHKFVRNRQWRDALMTLDRLIRYMLKKQSKIYKEYTLDEKVVREEI